MGIGGCQLKQEYTTFETKSGFVALAWNPSGVSGLRLPATTEKAAEASIQKRLPSAQRAPALSPEIAQLITDIQRYFEGERIDFSHVAVDLGAQDSFFSQVYGEVRKLGWGETTTYGTVAKVLGADPQAARRVGQAMGANPVPLIVPCHRVLAAGGKIGGFSAPGGSTSKTRMLELEGVAVVEDKARSARPDNQIGFGF